MGLKEITDNILHPAQYIKKQIRPAIKEDKMWAEVVWTYTVARIYQYNLSELTSRL